jgi:hypothetical protein
MRPKSSHFESSLGVHTVSLARAKGTGMPTRKKKDSMFRVFVRDFNVLRNAT